MPDREMHWVDIMFDLRELRAEYEPEKSLPDSALATQAAFEFLLAFLPVFDTRRVYPELQPARDVHHLKANDWGIIRYYSTDISLLRSLVTAANDTAGEVAADEMSFQW